MVVMTFHAGHSAVMRHETAVTNRLATLGADETLVVVILAIILHLLRPFKIHVT